MPPRKRKDAQSTSPLPTSPAPEVRRPFESVTLTSDNLIFKNDRPMEYIIPDIEGGGDITDRLMRFPKHNNNECSSNDLISCVAGGKLPFISGCSYESSDLIKELELYAASLSEEDSDVVFSNTFLNYLAWLRSEEILRSLDIPTPKPIWGESVDVEMQTD